MSHGGMYFMVNGTVENKTKIDVIKRESDVQDQVEGSLAWISSPEGNTGE
jgi:predicted glutamine amidotransferase